jgi:hypothetical protein
MSLLLKIAAVGSYLSFGLLGWFVYHKFYEPEVKEKFFDMPINWLLFTPFLWFVLWIFMLGSVGERLNKWLRKQLVP